MNNLKNIYYKYDVCLYTWKNRHIFLHNWTGLSINKTVMQQQSQQ